MSAAEGVVAAAEAAAPPAAAPGVELQQVLQLRWRQQRRVHALPLEEQLSP